MRERVIIIDVNNEQSSYAALDGLIRMMEFGEAQCDINPLEHGVGVRIEHVSSAFDGQGFTGKTGFVFRMEKQLEEDNEKKSKGEERCCSSEITDMPALCALAKDGTQKYYYIRITSKDDEDVISLQFLVLLLQRYKSIHSRMICFFVPFSGYFNKIEKDDRYSVFFKYSKFLRLIEYPVFFGVIYVAESKEKNRPSTLDFSKLDHKKNGIQKTFLPLLEINLSSYETLTKTVEKDSKNSELANTLLEIADEIAKRKKAPGALEKIKYSGISLLHYLFLCAILPDNVTGNSEDKIVESYSVSSAEIADSIFQLLENIIRYAERNVGVFSFRLHKKDSGFIQKELGWSLNGADNKMASDKIATFLEVGVADYNVKETIIENFLSKDIVQREPLYGFRNEIGIRNLIGEHADNEGLKIAWREFQIKNKMKGMGLPRMKENAVDNNAFLFVKSSKGFKIDDAKQIFCEDYNQEVHSAVGNRDVQIYMPGTQFRQVFPIIEKEEQNTIYNSDFFATIIGNLKEDEEGFAKYFDYEAVELNVDVSLEKQFDDLAAIYYQDYLAGKDECVRFWESKINASFEEWIGYSNKRNDEEKSGKSKTVFSINLKDLCITGQFWTIETFCKGLICSKLFDTNGIGFLAVLNCSSLFMLIFLKTYIYSANWNNNTHIYLSGKNIENEMYIAGHDRKQIEKNIMQFAFPKRRFNHGEALVDGEEVEKPIEVFPFDVLVSRDERKGEVYHKTLFDEYIEALGEKNLTDPCGAGYKLTNTHMRLGSKVHLDSFYEIAILFQKPRIARKLAFRILRHLYENFYKKNENSVVPEKQKKQIWRESVLFYGYSSYTRMILESLLELAKKVSGRKTLNWAFAIYQNDIVIEKRNNTVSPIDSIYYSKSSLRDNPLELKKYSIVQIVPISTSLTTFKKMKGKLEDTLYGKSDYQSIQNIIKKNYTIFWVRNIRNCNSESYQDDDIPTTIEKNYWEKIVNENTIRTKLITPDPVFFTSVRSHWRDPLLCKDCYPGNLLDEKALIETDVTSTIPAIQLEQKAKKNKNSKSSVNKNEERILRLESSLRFGHVYRENNHFQFYFDTNELFVSNRADIEKWLRGLKKSDEDRSYKLSIIVTPLHHTNAGFCQCVNNTYFNGTANVISFDAAREYKSNVEAKYADIKETIKWAKELKIKVEFVYVDDTIISGTAFRRINNLVQVLAADDDNERRAVRIDEVFVLLNRMSESSKYSYTPLPDERFHAYIDLNISSVRNHGTSCVLCGLKRNAGLFYRRSSTKHMSQYWNKKAYEYQEISFDELDSTNKAIKDDKDGFFRMLCSHVARDTSRYSDDKNLVFGEILHLFEMLDNPSSPIYNELSSDKKRAIRAFLKVLTRPYFSFGNTFKQCILDFMLLLTESFIDLDFQRKLKDIVQNEENGRSLICTKEYINRSETLKRFVAVFEMIKKNVGRGTSSFVADYLVEGLTDLRSNYVIRKDSLSNLIKFIARQKGIGENKRKAFFQSIQIDIHRLINISSDETKSLWFEYLLVSGEEYYDECEYSVDYRGPKEIVREFLEDDGDFCCDEKVIEAATSFWTDVYIDNVRLFYDGTQHILDRMTDKEKKQGKIDRVIHHVVEDYYFQNFAKLIVLHYNMIHGKQRVGKKKIGKELQRNIKVLVKFLLCLRNARDDGQKQIPNVQRQYQKLKEAMIELVWPEKTVDKDRGLDIIVGSNTGVKGEMDFYSLTEKGNFISSAALQNIKEAITDCRFGVTGYYIPETCDYTVIAIQNNYDYLEKQGVYKIFRSPIRESRIAPVFVYIPIDAPKKKRELLLRETVRRVLMFKHQLLHLFEQDFNNNSIDDLVKNRNENELLARDKAGDHSTAPDLTAIQRLLQSSSNEKAGKDIGYWFLLRTYVNMVIARLYRRQLSNSEYFSNGYIDNEGDFWKSPLVKFGKSITKKLSDKHEQYDESDELIDASPRNYFSRLEGMFKINFSVNGVLKKEDISFDEFFAEMADVECVKGDKGYYRSDFIICIILDIFFSAINNSVEWEEVIHNPVAEWIKLNQFDCLTKIAEEHKKDGKKQKEGIEDRIEINIGIEPANDSISYLTFSNKKVLRKEEYLNNLKFELNEINNGRNHVKGFSLYTIKSYIENIWNKDIPVKVSYDYEEEDGVLYFVSKLPIIRRKENNNG